MNFNATLVVDDFLPDPDAVRDLALSDKIKWYMAWEKVTTFSRNRSRFVYVYYEKIF